MYAARAEPFDFPGDRRGVLCVHGFTGTPFEMRYLGQQLADRGLTVRGIALPGHATHIDDLRTKTWADWAEAVVAAYDELATRCDRVAVVGQSLGGLLAMHLATRRAPAAVASLAAPLWLHGFGGVIARTVTKQPLARWLRALPKLGGSDVRDPDARRDNPCYRGFPIAPLAELLAFMRVVDAELPSIVAPLLILHATQDHTAPVDSAYHIHARTRARDRKLRIFPESYHLLAIDVERDLVAAEVGAWCERYLAAP